MSPAWKSFKNSCADANGNGVAGTKWKAGSSSRVKCQSECRKSKEPCSAIVWYKNGNDVNNARCYLILDSPHATKGRTGARYLDAMCFINPAFKSTGKTDIHEQRMKC